MAATVFAQGDTVWLADREHGYVPGVVVRESDNVFVRVMTIILIVIQCQCSLADLCRLTKCRISLVEKNNFKNIEEIIS